VHIVDVFGLCRNLGQLGGGRAFPSVT